MTMKKYAAVALSQGTTVPNWVPNQDTNSVRHQTRKILAILTFENHNS